MTEYHQMDVFVIEKRVRNLDILVNDVSWSRMNDLRVSIGVHGFGYFRN